MPKRFYTFKILCHEIDLLVVWTLISAFAAMLANFPQIAILAILVMGLVGLFQAVIIDGKDVSIGEESSTQ